MQKNTDVYFGRKEKRAGYFLMAFLIFAIRSGGTGSILWTLFACSAIFFINSGSVGAVAWNLQSMPISLHTNVGIVLHLAQILPENIKIFSWNPDYDTLISCPGFPWAPANPGTITRNCRLFLSGVFDPARPGGCSQSPNFKNWRKPPDTIYPVTGFPDLFTIFASSNPAIQASAKPAIMSSDAAETGVIPKRAPKEGTPNNNARNTNAPAAHRSIIRFENTPIR